MGMSNEKCEETLANVDLKIKKRGTVMRMTISTKNKLQGKLLYIHVTVHRTRFLFK
jgi:hypothetical protein